MRRARTFFPRCSSPFPPRSVSLMMHVGCVGTLSFLPARPKTAFFSSHGRKKRHPEQLRRRTATLRGALCGEQARKPPGSRHPGSKLLPGLGIPTCWEQGTTTRAWGIDTHVEASHSSVLGGEYAENVSCRRQEWSERCLGG